MKRRAATVIGVLGVGLSTSALADTFVNPLDTVPKPNVAIGFDHSVTMGIDTSCSNCHAPGSASTRLAAAKVDILATMPLFRDYFVFGGFTYKGCGYAEVTSRYMPTPANPDTSYNNVQAMISALQHCNSRENGLPAGGSSWTNCITATPACSGDPPVIQQLIANNPPGISATQPTVLTSSTCGLWPASSPVPSYNVQASLLAKLAGGAFSWPRWDPSSLSAAEVQSELCDPLDNILTQIRSEMAQCFVAPNAVWDLTFLDGAWCDANTVSNTVCNGGQPLANTCVCDQNDPACQTSGVVASDCGIPFTWKARQQVAMCEFYNTTPPDWLGQHFGEYYQNQADNRVNAPTGCRENVGMLFTDGYMGDTSGVAAEALQAQFFYRSVSGLSNLFTFKVSNVFTNMANNMQQEMSSNVIPTAFLATDAPTMQASFAQVLARIYRGVYTGTEMGMSPYQDRAYFNIFTVPGYSATAPVTDTYIGWPQRIAAHAVDPVSGNISAAPIFETDWASKVNAGPGCGPSNLGGTDPTVIGPLNRFRNNVNRDVNIGPNVMNRNGTLGADAHPALRWGRSYGYAATTPLVVDAPREAPVGGALAASFLGHQLATRTRPRAIYTMTNGYILGYHGGTYNGAGGAIGNQFAKFTYNDSVGAAGTEILRYRPNWLNDPSAGYTYTINDLVMQPMMNGELEAKEVYHSGQWKTVLAGNSGIEGRGYFVLDITNPCAVTLIGEWRLPNAVDRASNEPKIYDVGSGATSTPMLIVTGGLGGSTTIYAYNLNGTLAFSRALPAAAGQTYAVTPSCVDTRGSGFVTHCYAVRTDGFLARVPVQAGSFGAPVDITPNVGPTVPIGGGRRYFTVPAVFFDAEGNVNVVYGSGNFQNLTVPDVPNFVFKAVDRAVRGKTVGGARADITTSCYPDAAAGNNTRGIFPLGAGERLISSPTVVGGGVYWSTYTSQTNGCVAGSGEIYAMNYESCRDILNPGNDRPVPAPAGNGIPMTPVVHRQANVVYSQTTAGPTAAEVGQRATEVRGGAQPFAKRLYWRLLMDMR
jgi:hypothetical protein